MHHVTSTELGTQFDLFTATHRIPSSYNNSIYMHVDNTYKKTCNFQDNELTQLE